MQDTLNENVNQNPGDEIVRFSTDEIVALRKTLRATHHLFPVNSHNFAGEWFQVFWKISLAMTHYFAECPDPAAVQRYLVFMDVFSDFITLLNAVNEPVLEGVLEKLR